MKKLKIIFHDEAISDLEEIWFYSFTKWSSEQADKYYLLLVDEIKFLLINPEVGKKMGNIRFGYRCLKVKLHLIFYRITLEEIEIVRILHEAMDIPKRLND